MAGPAAQIDSIERLVRESVATVDALAPDAMRAVLPALRAARDELRADLQDWLARAPGGADRFTALQRTQALRALEGSLERVGELEPAVAHALAATRHATGPLAIANLDTEVQRLSAIFGGGVPTIPQIDAAAIIARGDRLLWRQHASSAKRYAGAVGNDIRNLFAVGLAKGETFEQLVTRLRRLGDPRAKRHAIDPGTDSMAIADGMFQRHKFMAERLVRTEAMHSYNVQHDEAIDYVNAQRPDGEDEYLRRWDASADKRVCPICKALDRTVAKIGGTFKGGVSSPPLHPFCRCVVLAWLRRWGHMDGEVPAIGKGSKPPKPKQSKPVPTMREVAKIDPAARDFMDELGRGNHTAAMRHLDAAIARRGLVPSSTPNASTRVTDVGMVATTHSGNTITAWGYREWDGNISISTIANTNAQKYGRLFGHQRPDDLHKALTEHSEALAEHRRLAPKKLRDSLPRGNDERYRASEVASDVGNHAHGITTILHEQLHGFSPAEPSSYRGHGGQVEEITNEAMTRRVAQDMFGLPARWHVGAYYDDMKAATDALVELTGKSPDAAFEDVMTAAERFKRRTTKLTNAPAMVEAFAQDIAHVAGTRPIYTEGILTKHLDIAARATAARSRATP